MANAEIRAPSLAIFVRGTHEVGAFIELLCQHQCETENKEKENKFWILHGFLDWPTEESPLGKWSTQALAHGQRCQLPFLRTWKPALGRIRLRSPPHKPTQSTTSPRSTARVTWNRVLCSSRHPAQTITMSTGWVLPRPEWQCCIYLRTLDQMRMLSSWALGPILGQISWPETAICFPRGTSRKMITPISGAAQAIPWPN